MSRQTAPAGERTSVADFVQSKMSNGFIMGGARPSEREIKAANARVPVPTLFPRKTLNDKGEKAAT